MVRYFSFGIYKGKENEKFVYISIYSYRVEHLGSG